jgi:hypothetical protein
MDKKNNIKNKNKVRTAYHFQLGLKGEAATLVLDHDGRPARQLPPLTPTQSH